MHIRSGRISELLAPQLQLAATRHQQLIFQPELETVSELRAHTLSRRERQVVQLVAEGKSNKEMAGLLNLSCRTIESYRARLMSKLDLHSLAQLVRYALHNHIV